jgi:hypothetical protein
MGGACAIGETHFYAVENNSSDTTTANGMCCYVSCNVLVGPDFGISPQARSH